jgi:cephalosporin hydroxylase
MRDTLNSGGTRQAEAVRGRRFEVGLAADSLSQIQSGVLRTRYRGLRFAKNPFDVVLYLQLFERLKPATVIEIGSSEGGSALWFRDQLTALGVEARIESYDLLRPKVEFDGVVFHQADATRLRETTDTHAWSVLSGPRLFVEDSAHTYRATRECLAAFAEAARPGDYIVVEDGVVADLPGLQYARYQDGPNRAVKDFLESPDGGAFEIDEELCDFFGHNVTYCPNAWLRRL